MWVAGLAVAALERQLQQAEAAAASQPWSPARPAAPAAPAQQPGAPPGGQDVHQAAPRWRPPRRAPPPCCRQLRGMGIENEEWEFLI